MNELVLTDAVLAARLRGAMSAGEVLDLAYLDDGGAKDDNDSGHWPSIANLPAHVIRNVLLEFRGDQYPDPNGLQIANVNIIGNLDLDFTELRFPIRFNDVKFDGDVWMRSFRGTDVHFVRCSLSNLHVDDATIENDLLFTECEVKGWISASSLSCGGLNLASTQIRNAPVTEINVAVHAPMMNIRGNANFDGLVSNGQFSAIGLSVGGYLSLRDAKIEVACNSSHTAPWAEHALLLDSMRVGGVVHFNGLSSSCSLLARGARIGGQLQFQDSSIGPRNVVQEQRRSSHRGTERMGLDSENTCKVELTGLELEGDAWFNQACAGALEISNSRLGDLTLLGAMLGCSDSHSLWATDSRMGNVVLDGGRFLGIIDFGGAQVARGITTRQRQLPQQRTKMAGLILSYAHVSGNITVARTLTYPSGIMAQGATVVGEFSIEDASRISPIHSPDGTRLGSIFVPDAQLGTLRLKAGIALGSDIDLSRSTVANLELGQAPKANLAGNLAEHPSVRDGRDVGNQGWSSIGLKARQASIGSLHIREDSPLRGNMDLSGATITNFYLQSHTTDDGESHGLPSIRGTENFSVIRLGGTTFADWKAASKWLSQEPYGTKGAPGSGRFHIQPWMAVADAFAQAGLESDSRKLKLDATDRFFRERANWFAKNVWRRITKYTIGHGYYSQLAIGWMAALWLVSTVLVGVNAAAFSPSDLDAALQAPSHAVTKVDSDGVADEKVAVTATTTPAPPAYPALVAPLYAVDIVLSPVGTGQSDAWRISTDVWLSAVLTGIKLLSWALLGLFASGVTGMVSRK